MAKSQKDKPDKHYHTFERMKSASGRKDMYRCMHPDCSFYAPVSMIMGKFANCHLCHTRFVLTANSLRLKRPHCGCNQLSVEQRDRLMALGKTADDQQSVAMEILEMTLRKGIN